MRALLALGLGLMCLSLGAKAQGQVRDRDLTWLTLRTEHFDIHYHEPLGILARRVAAAAERANTKLVPLLKHAPSERTHVVLSDNTDDANGLATSLPYNTMRLFATAPEDLSALDDYDDWLSTLVIHEYTHVLHLDTVHGIPAILNAILGKTYAPNGIQPRWFIEGFAVLQESKHTAGGRERSTTFEMFMRTDALENRLLTLSQMTHPVDRWPHGNNAYLYGSRFLEFIEKNYGSDALAAISNDYGDDLIPYAINRTAKRATGKTYPELYADFLAALTAESKAIAHDVRARGLVQGQRITFHGEWTRSPRFWGNDRVVYWSSDGRNYGQLKVVGWTGGTPTEVVRVNGPSAAVPTKNGDRLYYSSADVFRDIYSFNDLFRFDTNTETSTRLSTGLRAREPDLSPDGKTLAFTVNGAGTTHLAVAPADDPTARRIVLRSPRFGQVYTPRWSPDGGSIAVSTWKEAGFRDIEIVDVRTGARRQVTRDRALDTGPAWAPDGRTLYFASDRSGIANIYAYDLAAGTVVQITNVLNGAYQPDISPDGKRLVYLGYNAYGWDLYALSLEGVIPREAPAYEDLRPEATTLDMTDYEATQSRPYSPLPTLTPRAFTVGLGQDAFGRALTLGTMGEDAVGYHSYAAEVSIGFENANVNASLQWTYQRMLAPITVSLFHSETPGYNLVVAGAARQWLRDTDGGDIGLRFRLPQAFDSHSLGASYAVTRVSKAAPFGGRLDPNDPPPILPNTGIVTRLRFGWSYSNVVQTAYDISPSWGHALSLSTSMSHPYIGSETMALSLSWNATKYIENPWADYQVLALRYAGATSEGRPGDRANFAIGGFPASSIVDGLVDGIVLGGVAFRGYPVSGDIGTQYHLLQAEYRFLLCRVQWGPETLPFFLNRIWANVFTDVGDAFSGNIENFQPRVGSGVELLLDFTQAYYQAFTLRMGAARGWSTGGEWQFYFNLGSPF
jgi:Tol biopolymer transport system component